MTKPVRIILLEDLRTDADIIRHELKKADFQSEVKWVQSGDEYKKALEEFSPHLVISDHSMPGFKSIDAFQWLKQTGLDIPFILVTATISEEFAVMMMREGIADYLLKDRLQRLPLAVTNALDKWESERVKRRSLELVVQNEKRFRALIENSHDMIGVIDEEFRPVFLSSSYTRITGRTIAEWRDGGLDYVHSGDREHYYKVLNMAKATSGVYVPLEFRMLRTDGNYIWVRGTVINKLDDDGIHGILFNLRDVTARKEAEQSLMKSKANMDAIIENSNVSIYSIDRQFRYMSFNSYMKNSVRKSYGMDIKVGDIVFEFLERFDPSEVEAWQKVYIEAFTGNRVEFEKEFSVGERFSWIRFVVNPIIEGDYITGLACFGWDITEQKLAALELSRSEARVRALLENNTDAIIMRDANRKVMYASPSIQRMLQYTMEEIYNVKADELIHPDDVAGLQQSFRKILQNPNVPVPVTARVRKKNGSYIWTEGTTVNMLDNEKVRGVVSNFRDITERKEGELQRERITLDLVERNKNLEQYAYIVSHNLRGPVANILGLANLIELAGSSNFDKEESLKHLFNSARNLDGVIRDLNMILQLQQGVHEQKEDIAFSELLNEIKASMKDLLDKSKVEITSNFKVGKIATVRSYLYSIFYNLITNSIKYKKEGVRPIIDITSESLNDRIRLRFVDNGIGIDLATQGPKVFGLYKRFHPDYAEGKGMGLFMTKTQVETLGGKISVKSQVNIGTEFIIDL